MNKHILSFLSVFLIFATLFPLKNNYIDKNNQDIHAEELSVSIDKRACWISFLDIEEFLMDLDEASYRKKISEMYRNIQINNMNTVIFHVRPMGDAVYPSDIFPWSVYISSKRNAPDYDPLLIAIEEAHKCGMFFEAWINPYRLSRNNDTTEAYKLTEFYGQHKDIILEYYNVDGELCLSLDPSKEESKEIICDGVKEIVEKYEVDGIHFDDYFYVDGMGEGLTVEEKMTYVDDMISTVYKNIKDIDSSCFFGISPAGNIDNAMDDGADIKRWMSEKGYIDYIMPQLYWTDEFISSDGEEIALFSERCQEWQSINELGIPIYAGLALYKAGEMYAGDTGWGKYDDNLKKQCDKAYQLGYSGYALFRYAWLEYGGSVNELDNLNNFVETLSITVVPNDELVPVQKNEESRKDEDYEKEKKINESEEYICNYDKVKYDLYCQGLDGNSVLIDGRISGIHGIFKGIGAVRIRLTDELSGGGVEYRVHSVLGFWTDWVKDDDTAGDKTSTYLIDGIQIRLYGNAYNDYDLFYRTGYFDDSYTTWQSDGDIAGDIGIKGAISSIELKLIKK